MIPVSRDVACATKGRQKARRIRDNDRDLKVRFHNDNNKEMDGKAKQSIIKPVSIIKVVFKSMNCAQFKVKLRHAE